MGILGEMKAKQGENRLAKQVVAAVLLGGVCWGNTAFAATTAGASLDEYTLDDVVVTAERIPTQKMDTPANVEVVTAQEIAANH